jgi:pimeloyl-ACP methyl ester carboxylesterase
MNGTRRQLFETPLGQVNVVFAGPESGLPLVLLHQTPRSSDEFKEAIPLLARTRGVIAIDSPGYGCSDPVPGQPSIADYAGCVVSVLDQLAAGKAVFVGHHTGAVIAIELAAGHPERVERLVLSGPVYVDAAGRAELLRFFEQWRVRPDGSHFLDKWEKFLRWVGDPTLAHRLVADLFRAGDFGLASEQGHFAVAAYRMEERLPLVRCPALLLFCARDPFTDRERAAPLREAFRPAAEVTIDAGVFAANERPELWAQAVLDYVGGG